MLLNESKLLDLAERVVNRYVNKGIVPLREKEDTQMFIVEKFLLKQGRIQENYSGKANINTYCISVLNNMCCEVIRKELKHWKNELDEVPEKNDYNIHSTSQQAIIKDEINYLDKIFQLFDWEKTKVNLALCYYYQLDIHPKDLLEYTGNSNFKVPELNLEGKINKSEILNNLAIFVGTVEKKEYKPDAVRMWLTKSINTIVDRLNSPFNRANYDKESFRVLYELYNAQRN